ncbi:hypothetical protein [Encephalitozoon cuniculi GB-M1]|uniref:Ricin B lectin domain-containing protein n=1 Tax=Encephalitozoon cuniculi (strain GB-M1) TaxID=284813 RepID=Q8SUK3_ENCCU|nr:uncharacterized protein ECU08_1710 [Encephalitozoon cuniculi GB-M1]CAD26475.3 hypothetical protein [Encephalitozoon cuniculi GB-M1]
MRSAAVICMLVGTISGFTISSKTGTKRYLVKGGTWLSPDYKINYQLAAMSSSGTAVEFQTEEISPGTKIIKEVGTNDVLDLHHPKSGQTKLIFHSQNTGNTQKFEIGGDEKSGYYLKNNGKCLEYDGAGNMYGTACSSNPEQKFDIVYSPEDPEYKPPVEAPEAPTTEAGGEGFNNQVASENPSAQTGLGNLNIRAPQIVIFNEKRGHHAHSQHHKHHEGESSLYSNNGDYLIV